MSAGLRQGRNPLSYLGVDPSTPPMMIIEQRDPTNNDYAGYEVGSMWLVTSVPKMWLMINKNPSSVAKWVQVYPGDGSGTNFFETNSGTASENAGSIKIKGSAGGILTSMTISDQVSLNLDNDVVIVNSLTISTMAEGVVVSNASGLLSSAIGSDLQFLVGNTGSAPTFATLVSEDSSVTIASGTVPGTINIEAVGGGGGSGFAGLIGENSVTATPSADKVKVLGDELGSSLSNIYTEASGHQINIFHSAMLNLGETDNTGNSGVIKLDGDIYFSAYGFNNLFIGKSSGNLTLNTVSAEYNLGIGSYALSDLDTSIKNTAVGYNSLASLDSGNGGNCCLGYDTGSDLQTGESNILIGSEVGKNFSSNESHNILIGDSWGLAGMDNKTYIGFNETDNCFISGIYEAAGLRSSNGVVQADDADRLVSSKGSVGQILISTATGVTWQDIPPSRADKWSYQVVDKDATTLDFQGSYWFNYGSSVLYASDDLSGAWSSVSKGDTNAFSSVGYGNGNYSIMASGAAYFASDPLGSWTKKVIMSSPSTIFIKTLLNDGTYWGAFGQSNYTGGFYNTEFYTATDPYGTWTKNASFSISHDANPGAVYYYDGYWILTVGSKLYTATDPSGTWTQNTGVTNLGSIYYGNGDFCMLTDFGNQLYVTTDPSAAWTLNASFSYATDYFFYVGDDYWANIKAGVVRMTDDPNGTWVQIATNQSDGLLYGRYDTCTQDIAYCNSKFVAVGLYGQISIADTPYGVWETSDSGTKYRIDFVTSDSSDTFGYACAGGIGFKTI